MAKKRQQKKKTRQPKVRSMEHLLKTGEEDIYGQICWSLGNRGTSIPRAGRVITLAGRQSNGEPAERRVRLTEQSIEAINQCLGMRTCGEAVSLFRKEPHTPLGPECPGGHSQIALDYMMYGIIPREPCPDCGHIPTFQGLAMSLGMKPGGKAKGIDGKEYDRCPECEDDLLELQGNDPVGWGWDIVCINCGWQIKEAEELDIQQYSQVMEDIKLKVEAIDQLMDSPGIINQTRVESGCLQLRMVLELIVFSSLVSNKDAWQRSKEELRSAWNIKKIMGNLKAIHRRFYPEPRGQNKQVLTEDRLVTVYDRLNKVIHAENPLGTEVNLREYIESLPTWVEWTKNLLQEHKVYLYHHPNVFYWVRMFGGPEGDVECTPVRLNDEGQELCSWPDCVQQNNRRHCQYLEKSWAACTLSEKDAAQTESKVWAKDFDEGQSVLGTMPI